MRVPLHSPLPLQLIIPPFFLGLKHLCPVSVKWCFICVSGWETAIIPPGAGNRLTLRARVSRATAQGCVFNYRVPRNPSLGWHEQQLLFWAWEPDLDCSLRGRSPREHSECGDKLGLPLAAPWLPWDLTSGCPATWITVALPLPTHKRPGPSVWSSPHLASLLWAYSPKRATTTSGINRRLKLKLWARPELALSPRKKVVLTGGG